MSSENRVVYPHNKKSQSLGEGIVLQKTQNSSKVFVKKGKTVNKTFQEEREFSKPLWSPLNTGEIFIQEAIEDERAESPRKACFRVHIVKNIR